MGVARRCAVASAAGGFDDEYVAGSHVGGVTAAECGHRAVGAFDAVGAERAGLAARHAVRGHPAVLGQRGDRHGFLEADTAHRSVAAAPPSGASAAVPDGELLQEDGQPPLQDLGVGEPRVRHVGLYDVGAGEAVPRAGAGGDGLVVLVAGVAEGDVVHRPGALRLHAEGRVQGAGDRLGGLHVSGDDGGGRSWGEQGAGRDDDVEGPQTAVVEGDVVGDQGAEDVQDGRVDHGERRVEVGVELG
jgi:hypothetical protein